MTEAELTELLQLIQGKGRYALIGGSIRTYPGADSNNHAIYEGCRALECRGLIRRVWQENLPKGPVVLFKPVVKDEGL